MWLEYLRFFNGVSIFHDQFWVSSEDLELFTDSAGGSGLGYGAYFQGQWFNGKWPAHWHTCGLSKDITFLELFPIVASVFVWGDMLQDKKIRFNCDNMAVVDILNKLSSKNSNVMLLVRILTLQCLRLNIMIKAAHVPGKSNVICDALSRFQLDKFRAVSPHADIEPQIIPNLLWEVFNNELGSY